MSLSKTSALVSGQEGEMVRSKREPPGSRSETQTAAAAE